METIPRWQSMARTAVVAASNGAAGIGAVHPPSLRYGGTGRRPLGLPVEVVLGSALRRFPSGVDLRSILSTPVGAWLSLVEHSVRDRGVGGSNPLAPTKTSRSIPVTWVTVHPDHIGNTWGRTHSRSAPHAER